MFLAYLLPANESMLWLQYTSLHDTWVESSTFNRKVGTMQD